LKWIKLRQDGGEQTHGERGIKLRYVNALNQIKSNQIKSIKLNRTEPIELLFGSTLHRIKFKQGGEGETGGTDERMAGGRNKLKLIKNKFALGINST
jgi:hypothetical protein